MDDIQYSTNGKKINLDEENNFNILKQNAISVDWLNESHIHNVFKKLNLLNKEIIRKDFAIDSLKKELQILVFDINTDLNNGLVELNNLNIDCAKFYQLKKTRVEELRIQFRILIISGAIFQVLFMIFMIHILVNKVRY